jgi:hypothetical protein
MSTATIPDNSTDVIKTGLAIIGGIALMGLAMKLLYDAALVEECSKAKKDNPEDGRKAAIDIPKPKYLGAVAPIVSYTPNETPASQAVLPAPLVPEVLAPIVAAPASTLHKRKKRASKSVKPVAAKVIKAKPFRHSDDFRTVICKGMTFALTIYQSMAVKEAKEAALSGFPEVHQEKLLREVGAANQRRLRDTFKSNPVAYKTLFIPGRGKGTFRLNMA